MDALVMAGGPGTRLGRGEKPLVAIDGEPMVDRVLGAIDESGVDRATVVTSPHTPRTASHVEATVLRTQGEGYVPDLEEALRTVTPPVLTVAADLPLLTGAVVDRVLAETELVSTTICVPLALPRRLGATVETTIEVDGRTVVPTGLNVVEESDRTETLLMTDPTLAVNVNRPRDARVAEVLS
ncbi:MAG: NTP transferase domain-containing protein [Halanaeroarchaeum sp.]